VAALARVAQQQGAHPRRDGGVKGQPRNGE
jgi:hypothetical protein